MRRTIVRATVLRFLALVLFLGPSLPAAAAQRDGLRTRWVSWLPMAWLEQLEHLFAPEGVGNDPNGGTVPGQAGGGATPTEDRTVIEEGVGHPPNGAI